MDIPVEVAIGGLVVTVATVTAGAVWVVGRVQTLAKLTESKVESSTALLGEKIANLGDSIDSLRDLWAAQIAEIKSRQDQFDTRLRNLESGG